MKRILIEDKVYIIKNDDFDLLMNSINNSKVISDLLDIIEKKYKPKLVVDNIFNYC